MTIGVRGDLADNQGTSSSNDVRRPFSAGSSGPSHPILIHLGYHCWFNQLILHDGQFLQSCSEGLRKYLHLKFPQCRLLGHWSSWVCLKIACPRPIGCVGFGETNSHYLWEHNMGMYQSPTKTVKHKFSTFWGCDRDPNRLGALHGKILGGTPPNGHLFWRGGKSLICRYPLIKEYGNRNMQNPPCDRYFSQNMQLSLAMFDYQRTSFLSNMWILVFQVS